MPLETYRRKRDFAKTPEPEPGAPPGEGALPVPDAPPGTAATVSGGGRFVVQRHRATRLHYDFRLEIGGVLVSWAVPRGPTLDPGQRRMAMHVEDHPIEYLDFEGVIPARQYGAGDVIVWDWGTWEPEVPEPKAGRRELKAGRPEAPTLDPAEAVAAGELKFRLHGEKLRGRFTIVRTKPRDGEAGEPWLLIHKRDDAAVAGWDAEDYPRSVKTGRTNDEVKADRDALWVSHAPAAQAEVDLSAAVEAPLPRFVEPMLATLASRPFDSPDWLFEVKWDGYRVQAIVREGSVRTFTRSGKDAGAYFPDLLAPPSWIAATTAVVDGEVVALDPDGAPSFELLQRRIGGDPAAAAAPLVYMAFDLLYLDGRSLLRVGLEDRKRLLGSVLREGDRVRYAAHVVADGRAFFAAAEARHLEGIVAKERHSRYEPGRRPKTWLKLKVRPEQELVVGGYVPGEGSHRDLGALLVGVYEGDRLRYAGRVGSGLDGRTRATLRDRLDALARPTAPFDPAPERTGELREAVFAEPELVIRAEFAAWTRDGTIRQSAFKGLLQGHDPRSVVREVPVAAPAASPAASPSDDDAPTIVARTRRIAAVAAPALAATDAEIEALGRLGREGVWRVGGRDLRLTNLDKVLFPAGSDPSARSDPSSSRDELPITKRELIAYFGRIGPVMLPHLAERPLNLNRFPDGSGGQGFWQKNLPATAPAWLRRWREQWDDEHHGNHPVGPDHRAANTHLVADEVAALCWLGNQASFEIHAWTSRLDAPMRPTYALIDIDPGDRTTWEETLTLARLYRTALGHLRVRAYPKLTGKRGLQIWIPVVRRYSFAETSAWVEGVSRAVGAMAPDLVSWEWAVADRKGRARLDYTQNASIKTLVAPYAVRPLPGAPVSVPIGWDELDDPDLRPDRWTIRSILPRIAVLGDLFAGALTEAQELLPLT
jgi:bifunctional non-homologous end joining protein LigD